MMNNEAEINYQEIKEISHRLHEIILNQNQIKSDLSFKFDKNFEELKDVVLKLKLDVQGIRTELDEKLQNVNRRIDDIGVNVKRNNPGSFYWYLENLTQQQSDSFYTHENGYKMRLQLQPERHWIRNGIAITVKMVPGANDKSLQWPVEFDVRIGVLNQSDGQFFRSQKQIILFRSSTSTHESPFRFTPYDLSGSAWKNSNLVIKCVVN